MALAACGTEEDPDKGTNGVARLTAAEIDKKARAAADAASAVRLSGTLVSKGGTYRLEMKLNARGGMGSVTSKKQSFALLRVEDELFLKAPAEFWSHEGSAEAGGSADVAAADKLGGKYVKVPEGDPSYRQLRGFTDKKVLLDGLLALHGTVNKGGRDTVAGQRTIQILGGKGEGGAFDVSLEEQPYPVRVARGGGGGTVTLADWGKAFPLEAPQEDDTVDYGGQLPKSSG
ncbi:lipoprotein [Streptomyces griseus]|nr:lipoprotein [Streptomyces griseus]